jgi:hypothetical protein
MNRKVRSYASGLDFVYLNARVAVCRAPTKESEAERLSEHFHSHHNSNHLAIDCTRDGCSYISSPNFVSSEKYVGDMNLRQLMHFVHKVESYLSINPRGTIVIVCETGCDKSCLFASAFLLHSGIVLSTEEAIEFVNNERSPDDRAVMRSPSQCRYLLYYEMLLRSATESFHSNTYQLARVRIVQGVPNLHKSLLVRGCHMHVKTSTVCFEPESEDSEDREQARGDEKFETRKTFDQLNVAYDGNIADVPFTNQDTQKQVDIDLSTYDVRLRGDCTLDLYSEELLVMSLSFHTAFITNGYLLLDKDVIELASDDKDNHRFPADMKVELFFMALDDDPNLNII